MMLIFDFKLSLIFIGHNMPYSFDLFYGCKIIIIKGWPKYHGLDILNTLWTMTCTSKKFAFARTAVKMEHLTVACMQLDS